MTGANEDPSQTAALFSYLTSPTQGARAAAASGAPTQASETVWFIYPHLSFPHPPTIKSKTSRYYGAETRLRAFFAAAWDEEHYGPERHDLRSYCITVCRGRLPEDSGEENAVGYSTDDGDINDNDSDSDSDNDNDNDSDNDTDDSDSDNDLVPYPG